MALKNKSDGRYIKILRESAVFRLNGVSVTYMVFLSRAHRDEYYGRGDEISKFITKCVKEIQDLEKRLFDLRNDHSDLGVQKYSELNLKLNNLIFDCGGIQQFWNNFDALKSFKWKDFNYLKSLGFDNSWFEPVGPISIETIQTGPFTNQDFSYECLYKELKKIFKDDYVDC